MTAGISAEISQVRCIVSQTIRITAIVQLLHMKERLRTCRLILSVMIMNGWGFMAA
jgi:hypothetical protein